MARLARRLRERPGDVGQGRASSGRGCAERWRRTCGTDCKKRVIASWPATMSSECAALPRATATPALTTRRARAVLARLQSFLPELQASNQALEQSRPEQLDIEVLTDPDAPHIEMVRCLHDLSPLHALTHVRCRRILRAVCSSKKSGEKRRERRASSRCSSQRRAQARCRLHSAPERRWCRRSAVQMLRAHRIQTMGRAGGGEAGRPDAQRPKAMRRTPAAETRRVRHDLMPLQTSAPASGASQQRARRSLLDEVRATDGITWRMCGIQPRGV